MKGILQQNEIASRITDIAVKVIGSFLFDGGLGTLAGETAAYILERRVGQVDPEQAMWSEVRRLTAGIGKTAVQLALDEAQKDEALAAADQVARTLQAVPLDDALIRHTAFDAEKLYARYRENYAAQLDAAQLGRGLPVYERVLHHVCAGIAKVIGPSPYAHKQLLMYLLERTRNQDSAIADGSFAKVLQAGSDEAFMLQYRYEVADHLPGIPFTAPGGISGVIPVSHLDIGLTGTAGDDSGSAADLLTDGGTAVLVGPPGSGKSHVLQQVLVARARGAYPALEGKVPFYVDLRLHDGVPTPTEALHAFEKFLADDAPEKWATHLLLAGRALVLYDHAEALLSVEGLTKLDEMIDKWTSSGSTVIVAGRDLPLVRSWAEGRRHRLVRLRPLSAIEVFRCVTTWFEAAAQTCRTRPEQEAVRTRGRQLVRAVGSCPDLLVLATCPRLLTLLCAGFLADDIALPEDAATLVKGVLAALTGTDAGRTGRQVRDLTSLYGEIARWSTQNLPSFTADAVGRGVKATPADIECLVMKSALLTQEGDELRFINAALREHLAAGDFVEHEYLPYLREQAFHRERSVVVVAAASHLGRIGTDTLLGGILDAVEGGRVEDDIAVLTAYAAMRASTAVDPDVRQRVETAAGDLLPPSAPEQMTRVVQAGPIGLRALVAWPRGDVADAVAVARCVIEVVRSMGEDALPLLVPFATDGRVEVRNVIMEASGSFDDKAFAEIVIPCYDPPLTEPIADVRSKGSTS